MNSLFDLIEVGPQTVANDDWRPEAPPCLDGVDEVYFNFETNGLRWFDIHEPIALSIYAKGRSWYLPWGHSGAGNLDEATVYRFAQVELKGKSLRNINTRFDIHMGRKWGERLGNGGLDLEEMGCSVSDVGHYGALLDDHRFHTSLDSLIPDYLNETPMIRLDESRMVSYSAGAAQARARYNVESVKRLKEVMWPKLDAEGLQKVRKLEDDVIFPVVEMEKNGCPINQPLLEQWIKETHEKYVKCIMEIWKQTGLKINPNSGPDCTKLFRHLNIPILEHTPKGAGSFPDEVLKAIPHPTIKLLRYTKKLKSINSKLRSYRDSIDSKGILRYALHQLRMAKDESADSGDSGTCTGRFTSTEIVPGFGVNIQQVLKPEKQFLTFGDEFFVRELFIPASGLFLSADAEQIQYRLFAHEANNPKIIQAYQENPWLSFHKMIHGILKEYRPDLSYRRCKDVNFAKLFAAGLTKLAWMLEFITKKEFLELREAKAGRNHPKLQVTAEILKIYDREVPEVAFLLRKAENLAKERGYVKDILGRRMRFPDGQRLHKALNGRIQMSEASIVKTKVVELHKNRKYTGFLLRLQVHDEVDGDAKNGKETEDRVKEILNAQSFPDLRVPILWGVKTGTSWGDCSRDELAKLRAEAAAA